jgi:hypothetical protein
MPIEVPSSALPPGVPQFHGEHLPQGEQEATRHLNVLVAQLVRYEWQFRHAVTLFDLCRGESDLSAKADITNIPIPRFPIVEQKANTLHAWEMMAARDGALAIYHFGQALTAVARGLGACPTIRARVDHSALRLARRAFEQSFPSYDAIRHAVGHAVDFGATVAEQEAHSAKPPWKLSFGNVSVEAPGDMPVRLVGDLTGGLHCVTYSGDMPVRLVGDLTDRLYCVTYRGRAHGYAIAVETLDALSWIREQTYLAFDAATDPEFYRCPSCEGRNLSEVYSRRVYRCTECNQPVTDEMMEVYRRRRRRTVVRSALIALLRARSQGLARAA